MVRIGRYAVAAAIAGLLAVLGAGCEGEPEPNIPSPTPTQTESSPSSSPTPQPESAEEFIERWVTVHTRMQNTGDTSEFREMSPDCEACLTLADQIDEIYGDGGFVETDGWSVESLSCDGAGRGRSCTGRVTSAPTTYVESAGGPEKRFPGGEFMEVFELSREGASWTMAYIAQQAE